MAILSTGKIAEVIFENALDTFESQDMMLDKVDFWRPDAGDLQNSNNFIWRNVRQHRPIITGWDLTGQEQGIIEETYPAVLGEPRNDYIEQRADDVRDAGFWERAGIQSGMRQASELNQNITQAMVTQGSMFYRSNATSGYNFIAEAQALMNERQLPKEMGNRCFLINDRDNLTFGQDLAARQTLQGRPENTWTTGQIGENVAEFDVYTGSFLPTLTGGADPATTVTGDQSFAPQGGSVNAVTGVVTNVDYRTADIPVAASGAYTVGDKVQFGNVATGAVNAVGLDDKTDTDQPMTFTIVAIPDATTITIFPKPIAINDGGLTALEQAYGNIDTQILNLATVNRINTDASQRTNLFWDMDAVEVLGGAIPAEYFKEFGGQKVISSTMKNGQEMYMLYDANSTTMNFTFRLFTWWGFTVRNPSAVGVAVTF